MSPGAVMQSPEATFFAQESHVLLRRERRMFLEEGGKRYPSHQPEALRSDQCGESRYARCRMPLLHDADGRRIETALVGGKMRMRDLSELIAESTGAANK